MGFRRDVIAGRTGGHGGRIVRGLAWVGVAVWLAAASGGRLRAAGADRDLDKPVQAGWKGVPLRAWADRVAEIAGRPVVIDRRLDPDIAVTLDARGEPLAAVLDKVARAAGAQVVPLRSSIRLVPVETPAVACDRAELARERAQGKLSQAARQAVTRRSQWTWPEGARPRDLVAGALDEAGVTAEGIDRVPHDHFPAASLPSLSLGERLDLVLAHFDLRIDWQRRAAGPVAAIVAIDDSLPALPARPAPSPHGGTERPQPSDPKPVRPDQARPPKPRPTAKQTFTLTAAAPLAEVLEAVAARLDVRLDIDRKALEARGIVPEEIVRVEVKNASAEELLATILGPLKLTGKVVDGRLEVRGAGGR